MLLLVLMNHLHRLLLQLRLVLMDECCVVVGHLLLVILLLRLRLIVLLILLLLLRIITVGHRLRQLETVEHAGS